MGLELRIRTTGWSRELVEQARNALRHLDPNEDHYVYEVVSDPEGETITLEDLEHLYGQTLGETARELDLESRGYAVADFDDLETEEIMDLWWLLQQQREAETEPTDLAEEFIRDFGKYLMKAPQ